MKKFISLAAAGALLLSSAGIVLAGHRSSEVKQFSFTKSETSAISGTGMNDQTGGSKQFMFTGNSGARSLSLTAGNVNVGGLEVTQGAFTTSETSSLSSTGMNDQTGTAHHHSSGFQMMGTGDSGASAGSVTVSNFSFSFGH